MSDTQWTLRELALARWAATKIQAVWRGKVIRRSMWPVEWYMGHREKSKAVLRIDGYFTTKPVLVIGDGEFADKDIRLEKILEIIVGRMTNTFHQYGFKNEKMIPHSPFFSVVVRSAFGSKTYDFKTEDVVKRNEVVLTLLRLCSKFGWIPQGIGYDQTVAKIKALRHGRRTHRVQLGSNLSTTSKSMRVSGKDMFRRTTKFFKRNIGPLTAFRESSIMGSTKRSSNTSTQPRRYTPSHSYSSYRQSRYDSPSHSYSSYKTSTEMWENPNDAEDVEHVPHPTEHETLPPPPNKPISPLTRTFELKRPPIKRPNSSKPVPLSLRESHTIGVQVPFIQPEPLQPPTELTKDANQRIIADKLEKERTELAALRARIQADRLKQENIIQKQSSELQQCLHESETLRLEASQLANANKELMNKLKEEQEKKDDKIEEKVMMKEVVDWRDDGHDGNHRIKEREVMDQRNVRIRLEMERETQNRLMEAECVRKCQQKASQRRWKGMEMEREMQSAKEEERILTQTIQKEEEMDKQFEDKMRAVRTELEQMIIQQTYKKFKNEVIHSGEKRYHSCSSEEDVIVCVQKPLKSVQSPNSEKQKFKGYEEAQECDYVMKCDWDGKTLAIDANVVRQQHVLKKSIKIEPKVETEEYGIDRMVSNPRVVPNTRPIQKKQNASKKEKESVNKVRRNLWLVNEIIQQRKEYSHRNSKTNVQRRIVGHSRSPLRKKTIQRHV